MQLNAFGIDVSRGKSTFAIMHSFRVIVDKPLYVEPNRAIKDFVEIENKTTLWGKNSIDKRQEKIIEFALKAWNF